MFCVCMLLKVLTYADDDNYLRFQARSCALRLNACYIFVRYRIDSGGRQGLKGR